VASDVALPRCRWWLCAMFVGGRWQLRAAMAVGDDGDVVMVVMVGQWCQVSWMVVGRKSLLMIDDAKLSISIC